MSRALSFGHPTARRHVLRRGFLAEVRTALLHDTDLLGTIDRWLTGLAGLRSPIVPLLRRTFGAFEAGGARRIGELVAGRGDGRAPAPYGAGTSIRLGPTLRWRPSARCSGCGDEMT
ncbi:MAG: DUF5682 family protein [Ilumatobacteraceae bacterium]